MERERKGVESERESERERERERESERARERERVKQEKGDGQYMSHVVLGPLLLQSNTQTDSDSWHSQRQS